MEILQKSLFLQSELNKLKLIQIESLIFFTQKNHIMNDIVIKEESTTENLYIIIQGQVDYLKNSKNNLGQL
jgi:hypothetical protein